MEIIITMINTFRIFNNLSMIRNKKKLKIRFNKKKRNKQMVIGKFLFK